MPMNLDSVGAVSEPGQRSWTSKDALLYALGVGAGQTDPTGFELEFTTENSQNTPQRVLPTFPVIIGMGAGAMPSFGDINWAMLVHGEQSIEVFGEIPPDGTVESVTKIVGIYDKGSGALAVMETGVEVRRHREARVQGADGRVHPRRGRLRRQPRTRPPGAGQGARRRPPTKRSPTRRAPTRRCSTASRATATRCTPTRRSRRWPGSRSRSSTASAPTA